MHVLIADDDEDHTELLVFALQRTGERLTVDRVADGEEALRYLRREEGYGEKPRPDLVLLDLKMPKVNGHEVLERLEDDPDLSLIPVVMLTTSNAEEDRRRAYRHRVNSYLVKPMGFSEYGEMVQDLVRYWGTWNQAPLSRPEGPVDVR